MGWLLGPDADLSRLPKAVLLPMENPDVYDPAWVADCASDLETMGTLRIGTVSGPRVAFSSCKFGAPAVAMAVDVFAEAGFELVVGVGFCGGLRADVRCGDLIVPSAAVRDEGATRSYVPDHYPAACSPRAFAAVLDRAAEEGIATRAGIVWTTDGILRETRPQVERWHEVGCVGVDMETAALYTVASLRGIQAVAILVASDNVYEGRQADLDALRDGWRVASRLAMNVCARLSQG